MEQTVLLQVQDHCVQATAANGDILPLVNKVTLDLEASRCVAIVGESGCGKTTLALSIAGLLAPGLETSGAVRFDGTDLESLKPKQRREIGGSGIGYIFQEPMSALHPTLTIGSQMIRPIQHHLKLSKVDAEELSKSLLESVGIPRSRNILKSYVHELSGGLRQRAMIAMALACKPRLIIADEPTTALDATVEAQILELLLKRRLEEHVAMILISHDLGLVGRYSDYTAVMYAGEIVEYGPTAEVLASPRHPYTESLLESVPDIRRDQIRLPAIPGSVPALNDLPTGCYFAPRCRFAIEACTTHPTLDPIDEGRKVRCWNPRLDLQEVHNDINID